MFSTSLNVCMWKALVNQQWSCRHTHTNISTLFEIYDFFIDPRVYLSNLHYWVIHMEDIHWVPNLIISKGNNEAKATKQQQVLASYIQYVSICIVLAIYIYNGYKNLSTYLSYTAGFLQAQELRELLKVLKLLQMVQLHVPGFQDFALPKHLIKKKKTCFPLVWMFACEKLWQINSGHADTHTQTYLHCLKSLA